VSGVDCFVVAEGGIANFLELVSVKVGAPTIDCAVGPVLNVLVFGGAIDLCGLWDWFISEFFPLFVLCDFFVDRGECVVARVLGSWFEYV